MTQLRKLENFRRDFVANVSHEIKTPLTVIRGAVETLQDGAINEPESARRFMEIISTHSERLNNLVQDILSLSLLEYRASGEGYDLVNCDLSLPLASAVKLEQPRAEEAGIRLVTEIEANPQVRIDVQLIEQAVVNLIDNAIKHSGEKSEIRFASIPKTGNAVLSGDRPRAAAPPPSMSSGCSSASTGSTRRGAARPAGPGSAWRSSSISCSCTAVPPKCGAGPARAARSCCGCRL